MEYGIVILDLEHDLVATISLTYRGSFNIIWWLTVISKGPNEL